MKLSYLKQILLTLVLIVITLFGVTSHALAQNIGNCDPNEPFKRQYLIGGQTYVRVVGRNADIVQFIFNNTCEFEDKIKDGSSLIRDLGNPSRNDISWYNYDGANTAFAVRYGRNRDLIRLYKPQSSPLVEPIVEAFSKRDGKVFHRFIAEDTVEVRYGENRDLVNVYKFQRTSNSFGWCLAESNRDQANCVLD